MSNKTLVFNGNAQRGQNVWNQTSGVKALMLHAGTMYAENVSGATGWASLEATDVMTFVGTVGISGTWASTEARDTFNGAGGVPDTGTWNDTEAPDRMSAYVAVPPVGTWASTEAPDFFDGGYYARQPRFEVESVVGVSGSGTLNTTGPNRLLCVVGAMSSSLGVPDQITAISDSTGLVWHKQDILDAPANEDGTRTHMDMWWAFAKNQITGATLTITAGGGFSFVHVLFGLVTIKGMGGNFSNPFSDTNPFSWGGNTGAFHTPPNTQIGQARPIATGQLSISGAVSSPVTFDAGLLVGATLDGTRLKVTSVGSGGPNNYATVPSNQGQISGKYYIEVKFKHIAGSKYGFGVAFATDSGQDFVSCIANGTGGFIVRGDGTIWLGGSQFGTIGCVPADNDIIGIAMDFDNYLFWARDVTQNTDYNGTTGSTPVYGSASHTAGGGAVHNSSGSPPSAGGAAHIGTGSLLVPFANVDGTSASAEIDANFGQAAFVGTPPAGYQSGFGIPAPAVTPTRVAQQAIVLGWDMAVPDDAIAQAPAGFTLNYTHIGDISAGFRLSIYSKRIAENILTTDNDLMLQPTATKHWVAAYDTIVSDIVAPGTLEATEAPDSFHAVGYGPGGAGLFGFLSSTEAKDVFHAVGLGPITATWASLEAQDTFSAFISVPIRGTLIATEAKDHFAGTGIGLGEDGVWFSTEALDTLTMSGIVPISGSFVTTETADRFLAIGAGVTTTRRRRRRAFVS